MEIKITLLLLLIVYGQTTQVAAPSILFISGDPSSVVVPVVSSLRGGKLLYIKANGHSLDPTRNLVYVGTHQCHIPADGVTDTFVTCLTGDLGPDATDQNNLKVTLISDGLSTTTSSPNVVHYKSSSTPYLRDIYPSAGFAGSTVNILGMHRISDLGDGLRFLGDVVQINLGDDICDRFDIAQDEINGNTDNYIRCKESSSQEAGNYNVSELVVPGYSNNSRYMRRSSLVPDEYFEFTALPTIRSVSPVNGNVGGQYLTITGTGFSNNIANNTVTVDGNDCKVTSASVG